MKKILFLSFLLAFAACKKNATTPTPVAPVTPAPDITETLSLSIVNQNPDGYDSARGHVSDTFSWSVPHAYGDTGTMLNGTFVLPPNNTTLIVECLVGNYGTNFSSPSETWLAVNNGTTFNTVGLTIGFPADTSYISVGYPIAGGSGGNVTWSDTVAADRPYGIGLSRMLDWWRGDAIPVNDTVINANVNINTNELDLIVDDTLKFTSKGYIGDEFVVSGTFSEKIWTEIGNMYQGSYCRKYWYVKGTFSNLIYVFKPG
jgi:hypothetical protein